MYTMQNVMIWLAARRIMGIAEALWTTKDFGHSIEFLGDRQGVRCKFSDEFAEYTGSIRITKMNGKCCVIVIQDGYVVSVFKQDRVVCIEKPKEM